MGHRVLSLYRGILATPYSVPPHIPRLRAWLFPVDKSPWGSGLPGSGREILPEGAGRGQGWDGSRLGGYWVLVRVPVYAAQPGPRTCCAVQAILVLGSSRLRLPVGRFTREILHPRGIGLHFSAVTLTGSTCSWSLYGERPSLSHDRSHGLHVQKGNKQSPGGRVPPLLQPDRI